MATDEFASMIRGELAKIERTLELIRSVDLDKADIHQTAAVGLYLQNVYSGLERVLQRFLRFYEVSAPQGADWHKSLILMFQEPAVPPLPTLFGVDMLEQVRLLLGFRHVVLNNYAADLDIAKIAPNIEKLDIWLPEFIRRVHAAIDEGDLR